MHLSPRDLDAFLRILPELYLLRPLDRFFEESTILLKELLRFDQGGWHIFALDGPILKTLVVQSEPPVTPQLIALVERGLADDPFTASFREIDAPMALRETPGGTFRTVSGAGIAEKMALPVADSPGEFCGLAFTNKQFGRFTERDRHMVMVLRPHLAAAYANAQQFSAIIAARTSGARVDLTPREAEIACVRTVEKHVERILRKLNAENRTAAAVAIREKGLLPGFASHAP